MRSLEFGRQAAKYIGNTAVEFSGIGRAKRAFKEEWGEKPSNVVVSLFYGAVSGAVSVAMPLSVKSMEKSEGLNLKPLENLKPAVIDVIANIITISFWREGNDQAALIAKISYNTLVQIAPDVAKLAKGRFFQKAK